MALVLAPVGARAQWRSQLDLGSLVQRDVTSEALTAPVYVSGFTTYTGRVGSIGASGFYSDGAVRTRREQRLSAAYQTPRRAGLGVELTTLSSSVRVPGEGVADRLGVSIAPSYRLQHFVGELRLTTSSFGSGLDIPGAGEIAALASYEWGPLSLRLSRRGVAYRETVVRQEDTVIVVAGFPYHTTTERFDRPSRGYRDAEATLDVRIARAIVSLRVGSRDAARSSSSEHWQSIGAAVPLTRASRLVAELTNAPSVPEQRLGRHSFARLGLQLIPFARSERSAGSGSRTKESADQENVEVLVTPMRRSIRLNNVAATRVELTGDLTDWQPVSLEREGKANWRFDGEIAPGAHHVMIRVDGGVWRVPRSLPTVASEFGQSVGLLVVER
jgi:hypothetical protein